MSDYNETGTCSICRKEYTHWGNNAKPINDGRCCDECNYTKVLPARFDLVKKGETY